MYSVNLLQHPFTHMELQQDQCDNLLQYPFTHMELQQDQCTVSTCSSTRSHTWSCNRINVRCQLAPAPVHTHGAATRSTYSDNLLQYPFTHMELQQLQHPFNVRCQLAPAPIWSCSRINVHTWSCNRINVQCQLAPASVHTHGAATGSMHSDNLLQHSFTHMELQQDQHIVSTCSSTRSHIWSCSRINVQ